LYLPEAWANDNQRRQQAGIRKEVLFETKLEIALGQIRQAIAEGVGACSASRRTRLAGLLRPEYSGADSGCVPGVQTVVVLGIPNT
jgi:hypothetical protein